MGWFDGLFGSGSSKDPFRDLDPKVRELLERESPVKYETKAAQPREPAAADQAPAAGDGKVVGPPESNVPQESLYQDGRYAHLWKTYRPLGDVEADTKTDQEKLMDMLEGYKSRNYKIGKAALENCALEQEAWRDCMTAGGLDARMGMCRHYVRRFERCYQMQSRFLKALGYLASNDTPESVNEDIQMHADALYQRLIQQEKAIEDAKNDGRPVPKFDSLVPKATPGPGSPSLPGPSEELQKAWKESLAELPEADRLAQERALQADYEARAKVAKDVQSIWSQQAEERKKRRADGTATWADTMRDMLSGAGSKKGS